jgi:flagellar hook-basal body complex protein FliE
MPDPLMINGLQTGQVAGLASKPDSTSAVGGADGKSFKDMLLDSLDQVNRLQEEANQGVERLMTGETDNMSEVFSTVRKADVAFSMLMEMRNKLVDAYREVQQMRV